MKFPRRTEAGRVLRASGWAVLLFALAGGPGAAQAQSASAARDRAALSSTAEGVYAAARSRLVQIRTLVIAAGRQSSLGSGFLVNAEGFAVTNYHVVSQYALEPETYRLEYVAPDASRGTLKLLAIDVANDLAVVRLDRPGRPYFRFEARALRSGLPKGERLYSMGNPLDLGFTIVEGTYNGLVERSYNERIHFSGALNPGMSGGPTVTAGGSVVGVNVAKRLGAELVSFLVPARYAAALVERAGHAEPLSPANVRSEIGRQLAAWQAGFYRAVTELGFRAAEMGPYRVPESAAPWFTCWGRTNADAVPKPRATVNATNCSTDTRLFVTEDLGTGTISIAHSYAKSIDLNPFQFAAFVSQQYQPSWMGWSRKRQTRQHCHEDFVVVSESGAHPLLRAVWCARTYREFEGLYDVSLLLVTQDRGREALVSRLSMQGVAYDNALGLARRFVNEVQRSQ
jgi:S1-C subfamily serine protease